MAFYETKKLIACADDFGLSAGVNRAIIQLIQQGALSATSVMSLCPAWAEDAPKLRQALAKSPADVGLHLTLTHYAPLTPAPSLSHTGRFLPLGTLILHSYMGKLSPAALQAEISAQLDAFEVHWGAAPDYVDGHQHVHVLPGVREILLQLLQTRYAGHLPYVRNCYEPLPRIYARGIALGKTALISSLGKRFAALAHTSGFQMNEGFSGTYVLNSAQNFATQMPRFISHLGTHPIVHVHPAEVDAALRQADPFSEPRAAEYAYLASNAWPHLLKAHNLELTTFKHLNPTPN